jgi:hypothetical protein
MRCAITAYDVFCRFVIFFHQGIQFHPDSQLLGSSTSDGRLPDLRGMKLASSGRQASPAECPNADEASRGAW